MSLFHQCKAWSSADRRHTRSESALVVGGQLLFRKIYLCPMYFYPNFLEEGFHAGSQCGPRSGEPMLHLIRVRTSRKWNHATHQCIFLLWQPGIRCRLLPEANSSGVPPSAYLPPIRCSAEHHTTDNVANTGVTSNSAGPDQAPRHAAPHPGRHRLYMSHIWNALLNLASLAS